MKNDTVRLRHMLEAIEKIQRFLSDQESFTSFSGNEMLVSAVERQYEIIGEACWMLSDAFQDQHSHEIPLVKIRGLRNLIAHEYFGVNTKILWDTARDGDLAKLQQFVQCQLSLADSTSL